MPSSYPISLAKQEQAFLTAMAEEAFEPYGLIA